MQKYRNNFLMKSENAVQILIYLFAIRFQDFFGGQICSKSQEKKHYY